MARVKKAEEYVDEKGVPVDQNDPASLDISMQPKDLWQKNQNDSSADSADAAGEYDTVKDSLSDIEEAWKVYQVNGDKSPSDVIAVVKNPANALVIHHLRGN